MKGKYRIRVQNRRLRYDFEIKRNITVIKGDSATGKTMLVDMIREYYENGKVSGVELNCSVTCGVLDGRNWKIQLSVFNNSILFIDEGNQFVATQEFAEEVKKSDNYFVIVTRESLPMLPYSVDEIYGIHNSGRYGTLKCIYNEMYHIYNSEAFTSKIQPDQIITEDSNSGFQFFCHAGEKSGILCRSAEGKSNIFIELMKIKDAKEILVVADGAAIGSEIDKLMKIKKIDQHIHLYLPESFEWLILQSGILEDREIKNILDEPEFYIDSREYFSWERFFTSLLIHKTQGTYLSYTKSKLNPTYLQKTVMEKIMKVMKNIDFSEKF